MLKNCQECGGVFAHPTRSLCDKCYEKEQQDFAAVKEYLQKNPGATVAEVALETEVDLDKIYEYIRLGRLNVVPSDAQLSCQICGGEIASGRICASCRNELGKSKTSPKQEGETTNKKSRVHYLDQIKDQR